MCIFRLFKLLPVSSFHLLQVKFEILLVSPQARGLKEGRTEVKWFLIFKFYLSVYGFVCFVSFVFGCFGVVVFVLFLFFWLVCLSVVVCSFFVSIAFLMWHLTRKTVNTVLTLTLVSPSSCCLIFRGLSYVLVGGRFDPAPFFVRVLVLDGWIW